MSAQTQDTPGRARDRWIWPFELQEKLGEGGMGVVYRARYVPKNRHVAVKMLSPDITNGVFVERFERELEILKSLRHPNIVHCFGGVCEDERRFYAMELVDGGTLEDLLVRRGRLGWEQAVEYALEMCAALEFAHERGIVHRDIKPANFLVAGDGRLKLSDFGLAAVMQGRRLTAVGKTMGTYCYMAPEQIRGKNITPQTDLYALGCVVYEMIAGAPPFDGEAPAAILHGHVNTPPPRLAASVSDVPAGLDLLIGDLLAKDPARRPQGAGEVAQRLRSLTNTVLASTGRRDDGLTNRPVAARAPVGVAETVAAPAPVAAAASGRGWSMLAVSTSAAAVVLLAWSLSLWRGQARLESARDEWLASARNGSPSVRLAALQMLGRVAQGSDEALEILEAALNDADPQVRQIAATSLGEMGADARPLQATLVKISRTDPEPRVRMAATTAGKAIRAAPEGGGIVLPLLMAATVLGGGAFWWKRRGPR
ncbi:MAG: protein kinase [Planctomycetes bacterium]|nr:protein kinase [Planctomycetota bacterium]